MKLKFEHGPLFGDEKSIGIKLILIDENKNMCSGFFRADFLKKISNKNIENLLKNIESSFYACLDGLSGKSGIPHDLLNSMKEEDRIKVIDDIIKS